ncbi:MAG: cytochrome c [Bacteroidota bacterium]
MGTGLLTRTQQSDEQPTPWDKNTNVVDVLHAWGEPYPSNRPADLSEQRIEMGRSLILEGTYKSKNGTNARRQSRFFICTNCHNMEKEDPDLRISDPEARLDFALQNGLPLLQGTTMYGTVNKVSWYNGDYYKKYGDLVRPAQNSLEAAIQLCAEVCSQGRRLSDDEMQSALAYFWSLQLKMGDLTLTDADWEKVRTAGEGSNPEMITWLKTFYLQGSPATFIEVPESKKVGYATERKADAARGKAIYNISCRTCHSPSGPSNYLNLNHDNLSLGLLRRHITHTGHLGLYDIIRHGTYADKGHRAYMPHYTLERMSNEQVEDIRAYVEQGPM